MSEFSDFIDSVVDDSKKLAKDEFKKMIEDAKHDSSDFIKMQAKNVERLTVALAEKKLTPEGYKDSIEQLQVLTELETLHLSIEEKARAQRLADGIKDIVIKGVLNLIDVG